MINPAKGPTVHALPAVNDEHPSGSTGYPAHVGEADVGMCVGNAVGAAVVGASVVGAAVGLRVGETEHDPQTYGQCIENDPFTPQSPSGLPGGQRY